MKYKKYPSYKDSGVEWLGEIPCDWNLVKLKYLVSITTGNKDTENKEQDGKYPFFVRSKNVERINSYSYDGEAILTAGDGDIGKIFHYINGKFDYHQRVYMFYKFKNILVKFIYFYLQENLHKEVIKLSAKTTVDSLRLPMLQDFIISVPAVQEQQQIATFLDNATAKIDTLIEKQTKQIELLKEKRQAVISHAVTKGINPNVKMKDSGVEWLGVIPEHWEVSKLKFYTNVKGRIGFRGYTKDDLVSKEEDALVIGASEMNNNAKLEIKKPQYISWYKYYESPEIILNQGDLLFVQRGSVGKVAHIDFDIEEATINPSLVVLKRIKLNPFYLKYYLLSNLIKAIVKVETSNTAIPMISQEQIGNYTLSFPKKEDEQQQIIVNYLDEKTSKIDILIEKSNKSIELLKEKRTALISAAVTGKIDVREFE